MIILAKYNTALTLRFPVVKRGSQDLAASGDWTPATGDAKLSKDGGNVANATNNPTAVGGSGAVMWSLALTATEMLAEEVVVQIVDAATKAIEDQVLVIHTYGDAGARHAIDLDDAVRAGLTALPNANAEAAGGLFTRGSGAGQLNQLANGQVDVNLARWLNTAPASLTASGYVQAMLLRWLSDNAGGTPNALTSGRVDASVGAMAAAVLTDASIAADAITAAKIAADVGAEIADAVWDEATSGHQTAGTTGKAVTDAGNAGTPPSVADIADAVWDEALAGHASAGSSGERLGRVPNAAAGASGGMVLADAGGRAKADVERWEGSTPNALISGRVDANAQVVGDKTGYALSVSPPTAAAIADQVWDEALAGHLGAGSTGEALDAAASSSLAGPGALQRTIGVTVAGNPLQGASVWVATDAAGSNVIAGPLVTNSNGEVTVLLDAGTYYVWVRLDGYAAIVSQSISVS